LTDENPDGHGNGKSEECTDCRTDRVPVSKAGLRRRREDAGYAPIRLRYWDRSVNDGLDDGNIDLSSIVVELPLSELARLLPQRLVVQLYSLVRKLLEIPEGPCFPCSLADVVRNRSLLSALRAKLAHIKNLSERIADPPAILIEERQKLFFYRGVPVMLRPVSFSYLLLLAQTPREFVMREVIYSRLWPGEMDYEGSNKPYERQITDHKRKLIAEIRKGIADRLEIGAGEMKTLIATRHKMGYMLNFARENVLILRKRDFGVIAFLLLLEMDRFFSDWLLDTPELLFLW
jgi:DNA-binding winged helix-turn-helix (wHTH) protein